VLTKKKAALRASFVLWKGGSEKPRLRRVNNNNVGGGLSSHWMKTKDEIETPVHGEKETGTTGSLGKFVPAGVEPGERFIITLVKRVS